MSEEFNWLDYVEPEESAPAAPARRSGLRRFLPRRPGRPRLPRLPRLPGAPRLPLLRRSRRDRAPNQASATDLLDERTERPLAELDDRLRELRERSAASSQPAAETGQALYDVDDVLVAPEIMRKPGGVISAAALSKAQQQQVELLRDIVGGAGQSEESSGGRLLPGTPLFSLRAVPRLIGTAALILVVSLPFVSSDFSEGELPPSEFHEDRRGAASVYNLLDNLSRDDYVLVAFEYGPTAAGELDPLADLVLRHIVAQRAVPLIVSSNPIAIAHAQNIIRGINRSVAFSGNNLQHGADYFILRYLPGGALGLRELSENFADVVRVSAKGALTGLQFDSLDEMSAIALISESAEDMRNWAEQVVSEIDDTQLLAFTGIAAAPLAQVYADSIEEILGLVVGYRDAYTYGEKLQANFGASLPERPEQPEVEPEIEPVSANTAPEPQGNQSGDAEAQVEGARATGLPPPTETPHPTATPPPTSSPLPTNTALPTATDLPTVTATLETILVVEVISPQQVRIRRGPTTADDILQLAQAGDGFEVLGRNEDGSWYNIALANGLEGWIAEFLVEERTMTRAEFEAGRASVSASPPSERVFLRREFRLSLGKNGPRFYQANAPTTDDILTYALMRDRSQEVPRLEAMTLGALAAALVIALGNVVYAFGALRGRRREGQGEGRA
jgi:hypothetical protein